MNPQLTISVKCPYFTVAQALGCSHTAWYATWSLTAKTAAMRHSVNTLLVTELLDALMVSAYPTNMSATTALSVQTSQMKRTVQFISTLPVQLFFITHLHLLRSVLMGFAYFIKQKCLLMSPVLIAITNVLEDLVTACLSTHAAMEFMTVWTTWMKKAVRI